MATSRETDHADDVRCVYCGVSVPTIEAAMEAGWVPYFYGDNPADDRIYGSCCPECRGMHLTWEEEIFASVAKPGHTPAAD